MLEKHPFPTCSILGVNIAVTNMKKTIAWLESDISKLSGSYICISNVHTTVTAYEEESYRAVQNGAAAGVPGRQPGGVASRERGLCGGGGGGGAGGGAGGAAALLIAGLSALLCPRPKR